MCSTDDDKISVVAGLSKSVIGKVPPAPDYVRHLCGKGGGRADMAQGGGTIPKNLQDALATIVDLIKNHRQ